MIETFIIITLVSLLFLIFFRPGKTPSLENRLLINRPGKYQIRLAAKLNWAQPFIEAVAKQIGSVASHGNSMLFFEICDRHHGSKGRDCYLLAIVCQNGMLHFQAEHPSKNPSDNLDALKALAIDELLELPARDENGEATELQLATAIRAAALECGVDVRLLTN